VSAPRLQTGYAFVLVDEAPGHAFLCDDGYWDIVVVGDEECEGARLLGKRSIDGSRCNVFILGESSAAPAVYAQTVASAGQSMGGVR